MGMIVVLLLLLAAYIVYTMMDSYRSMQKELRDIRLKCMGTATSAYTRDPTGEMKGQLVEGLTRLRQAAGAL